MRAGRHVSSRATTRLTMFRDRTEAGRELAGVLASMISPPFVLAAIPRGGVTVALPIVERTGAPLTVVYARKLTAPVAPELAFGAVDEDGETFIEPGTVARLDLTREDVESAKTRVGREIQRRMALYKVPALAHYLPGAAVVLVDDGLATGLTMRAAVAYARRHGARAITVAVPCASPDAVERFRREADDVVSLVVDPDFYAVGAYYVDFSPVSDDEVVSMLERAKSLGHRVGSAVARRRLSFKNSRGMTLAGELLTPAGAGRHPVVVFAHGWGSSKSSPRNGAVAEALAGEGIAAFLFDFTGHGESEGTEEDSTQAQQVDDLTSAIDAVAGIDGIDATRLAICGASSGGAIGLLVSATDRRVRALALRSANPDGAEHAAKTVSVPTLLVVGERDPEIRAANERLLADLAGPHRLEVVPRGDHLFEDPAALASAVAVTVAWLERCLA